eukprot:scaffold29930_cov53-Attheya_sp.AAC.2
MVAARRLFRQPMIALLGSVLIILTRNQIEAWTSPHYYHGPLQSVSLTCWFTNHHRNIFAPLTSQGRRRAHAALYSTPQSNDGDEGSDGGSYIENELERLQQQLSLIEAIEERNKAQLDSFVDAEDQWESLEEEERLLLRSKEEVVNTMDKLASELVQMWMGGKSMEG